MRVSLSVLQFGAALTPACAALLFCAQAKALEQVGSCNDYKAIDVSRLPSEEETQKLCRFNSDAAADKYEVDTGTLCEKWSACLTQYQRTRKGIETYNGLVRAQCEAINKYKNAIAGTASSGQAGSMENAAALYKKIQAQKKRLADTARKLASDASKLTELNDRTIAKYQEDREKLTTLRTCVETYLLSARDTKETWRCAKRWGKKMGSEAEVIEMKNGIIDAEMGGARSWAEYDRNIGRLIEEQKTAKKIGEWAVAQLQAQSALQMSDVAALNNEIKVVKEAKSDTGSLGGSLATGNQAVALGNGFAALGRGNSGSGSRVSSGSSSMGALESFTSTDSAGSDKKGKDPITDALTSALGKLGKDSEDSGENANGSDDRLFAGTASGETSAGPEASSGVAGLGDARGTPDSAGISGGGTPEGYRSLASYAAEKKGKEKGSSSGASRLGTEEGALNLNSGASARAAANSAEIEEENGLLANFSGEIRNQEDGLDGQSEIASILDQMQNMFAEMPGEGAAGANGNATAATNGLSRSDEIARIERFESKGGAQGATMAHQSEELMNFSLFSRVHLRHRKSMEKGLVIFGLRHRVE